MNEFDEAEEYENTPEEFGGPSKRAKTIKRILRVVGWIIFVSVLGVLFWRMCSTANDPKSVSTLMVNDELAEAYSTFGEDLYVYYQNLDQFTRGDENYGYFAVTQSVIIPAADQIQLVFRYNISTLEYLAEDYPSDFPRLPDRNADLFDVTLVKVIDLTPDNTEDNDDEENLRYERYHASDSVKDQTSRHNYERFLFENIDCEDALEVYVNIYYKGDLDYEDDAYGIIRVYTSDETENRCKYILSTADKAALSEALSEKNKLTR